MATLATDMPPLHTAEALAGVTTPASSQSNTGGGGPVGPTGIDSTQSPETETINNLSSSNSTQTNSNNTISAAADSSDNQPGTPQPHLSNLNDSAQNASTVHHPYANHHMYANSQPSTTTSGNTHLNQMYPQHIFAQSNMDLQQTQQQLQQPLTPTQHASFPSYLNSYEQFYQQQQQQQQQQNPSQSSSQTQNPQQMDYINSNTNTLFPSTADYKQQAGVRYHPYLHTPTSGIPSVNSQNSNSNNALDANNQTAPVVSSATSSLMSPRVVSSTSPSSSSNQMQISGSASSIGSMSAGNPSSPNSAGTPQCKKCGIMCTNESELQEHITNVHGSSPYGSSGYSSSPYIKEEMQQQTPPSQSQQQTTAPPPANHGGNPGEILDLDSQKMLYPPAPGSMPNMMHQNLGNTDPLHGLHNMQQRAGMNTWDQQSQEGLPPYLQQQQQSQQSTESKNLANHSPYYQSPKQSPYHVTNSSNVIKTEYQPIIKNEYTGDTQQYIGDKSFDPTAPNQQQQMMPPAVSSSPAEFPSTTTGGPQDNVQQNVSNNQQFRTGNFEPPSSSSATLTTGASGGKAANWKSNEARRPKTYNCTACNKWFTSSGHLKRHYNTTLHKNAVKSSGQPDPASLPISVHHHPARDPSGKVGRRSAAAAAAANAGDGNAQQQQQPPNPVQPPEPPNSPQDYGGPQVAAGGLTPLSHYNATPSPNSMYQQQQQYQQHQYMPQVQSTTNVSPQHASSMANHHLQQHQNQQQQQQQQTVLNGHPNALAGPSVPPTQQQTPMPSSQMRGLLNITLPSTTTATTAIHIAKSEHLEAATMEEQIHPEEVEELGYLTRVQVKQEYSEELEEEEQHNIYSPKGAMESLPDGVEEELLEQQESQGVLQHHHLQGSEGLEAVTLREVDHNVEHHHNTSHLPATNQIQHYQLDQQHQADLERLYHNTTPSSTHSNIQTHSPLIISHQQYQAHLEQQHQMVAQGTYTLTQTPPPPQQQLQHNIMEHQPYINTPLAINTQQLPNNMLQLQPSLITTEQQQLPPATTIPTTNMVNMVPLSHHHMQPPQQQLTELQPQANTQLQLDTINTNIPSHITTTSNITNMPSYHQLQHPGSVLPPLDPTLTYPHTIIGNTEVLTLDAYGNLVSASGQQVIQTSDGQLLQLISTGPTGATSLYTTQPYNPYMAQRSPQEGDLPPMTQHYHQEPTTTTTTSTLSITPSSTSYSPSQANSNSSDIEYKHSLTEDFLQSKFNEESHHQRQQIDSTPNQTEVIAVTSTTSSSVSNKRKRNPSTSSSVGANSTILPSGRIKCLPCDKEFTKICYLTQHNKSFHSGEYPYRCQKCGKRYQSEDVYVTHLGKHKTTDKAHKCELCPKQFHHKTDLRRHVEAIHTGNKQHSCDICEKSFCRKDHLRKHLETHNRPRVVSKKANFRGKNSSNLMTTFAKVGKKSKDLTVGLKDLNHKIESNSTVNQTNSRLHENNSMSSTTTSIPSPLVQQMEDVPADDDDLLEDELDEYDGQDVDDNEDYLTLPQYQRRIQSQYTVGKYEVYEIVEQELPMY